MPMAISQHAARRGDIGPSSQEGPATSRPSRRTRRGALTRYSARQQQINRPAYCKASSSSFIGCRQKPCLGIRKTLPGIQGNRSGVLRSVSRPAGGCRGRRPVQPCSRDPGAEPGLIKKRRPVGSWPEVPRSRWSPLAGSWPASSRRYGPRRSRARRRRWSGVLAGGGEGGPGPTPCRVARHAPGTLVSDGPRGQAGRGPAWLRR